MNQLYENLTESPVPQPKPGCYLVYILLFKDGALYIGQTSSLPERLRKHRYGLGAKFSNDHKQFKLAHVETFPDRRSAVARELQIKRWSRAKKEALISGDTEKLKELSRTHD